MASIAELVLVISGKDDASKVLEGVGASAGGLGKTLGDVGKIASGFLAADVIQKGVGALTSGIADSIAGFKEQMLVSAQTEAVIKSTGAAAGFSAQEIQAMAGALKNNSLFADDAIQSGENLLLTFTGIGKDVFPRATETMLDMSQALGQDMKSSAVQLGKALDDPIQGVTALRRVGVSFTDAQLKQIKVMQESGDLMGAQGIILAELEKEFGGSAKAASDAAGATEVMNDKMDDLQDTLGQKMLPVQEKFKEAQVAAAEFLLSQGLPAFERFSSFITETVIPAFEDLRAKVAPAIENIVTNLQELADEITSKLGPPLRQFLGWFDAIGGKQALVVGALVAITVAVGALAVALGAAAVGAIVAAAPIIAIGLAVAGVTAAVVLVVQHWDELAERFPVVGKAADGLAQNFKVFVAYVQSELIPAVQNIADKTQKVVEFAVGFFRDHWPEIMTIVQPVLDELVNRITLAIDIVKGVFDIIINLLQGDWSGAWNAARQLVVDVAQSMIETVTNLKDLVLAALNIMKDLGLVAFGALKDQALELVGGLKDGAVAKFEELLTFMGGLPGRIGGVAAQMGNALRDGFVNGVKGTVGVIGDLGSALLAALKTLINSAISAVNNAIPDSLSLNILGQSFGVDLPDNPIPYLAHGGIVRARPGGTLALLGEAGRDEAVIPLPGGGGGFDTGGMTVYGNLQVVLPNARNADDMLRELDRVAAW